MPIDPRIALGVQPVQIESPLNNFGKALSLQSLMGQQQLQRAQLDDYKRKLAESATLRDLMRGKSGEELETALSGAGYGDRALALRKDRLAGDKSAADTQKAQVEAAAGKAKLFANRMAAVRDQPSYEATLAELSADPMFAQMVSGAPKQWTPEVSQDAVRQAMIAHGKILETLPKLDTRDTGGALVDRVVDPITNQVTVAGQTAKTMTPGDVQQAKDSAASRSVTVRGQNLTDARAAESNRINAQNAGGEREDKLRKEFNSLPEVQAYKSVIPAQKSAQEAIARDTPQADMNLIYATAKIFDPTSVVREGEYATVNKSQSPAEQLQGMLSYLMNGGRLTQQTRRQLLAEIDSRARASKSQYDAARKSYEGIAKDRNIEPRRVFQTLDEAKPDVSPGAPSRADLEAEARRRGLIQ